MVDERKERLNPSHEKNQDKHRRRKVEKSCVTPAVTSTSLTYRINGMKTHTTHIPPWEDQCEWHRMTRMTGPDCAVMCNLINTHTQRHRVSSCFILL